MGRRSNKRKTKPKKKTTKKEDNSSTVGSGGATVEQKEEHEERQGTEDNSSTDGSGGATEDNSEDGGSEDGNGQTPKKIGTHNGNFHCDEALACFMLRKLRTYKDAEVIRTRDPDEWATCDVLVDVGDEYKHDKKRYDHHQSDFVETMNSLNGDYPWTTKLSSAGLVYFHYGHQVLGKTMVRHDGESNKSWKERMEFVYCNVYKCFIEAIDGIDNGTKPSDKPEFSIRTSVSHRVPSFLPSWNEPDKKKDLKVLFFEAMKMVGSEFEAMVSYYSNVSWPAKPIVQRAVNERNQVDASGWVICLETNCPWEDHLHTMMKDGHLEVKFVLYEDTLSDPPQWKIKRVSKSSLLPKPWRGLNAKQLCDRSGIPGCTFVHSNGHVGGGSSKDVVLAMALVALAMATAQEARKMFDKQKFWVGNMVNKADEAKKMADEVLQMAHDDELEMASKALAKACRALAIMKAVNALAKATNALEIIHSKKLEQICNDEHKKATMAHEMAQEAEKMADEVLQMAHDDELEMAGKALAKACRTLAIVNALDAMAKATNALEKVRSKKLEQICNDERKKATMTHEMANEAKEMADEVLQMAHGDQLQMAGKALAKACMALSMAHISQAMMTAFDALTKAPKALELAKYEEHMKLLKARQMAYNVLIKLEMARDHQMKVRNEEDLACRALENAESKTRSKADKEYNKACEASKMAQDMLLAMSYEAKLNAKEALEIISPYQAHRLSYF